jgi:hypothetical protein
MKTTELRLDNLVQFKSQLRGWIIDKVHADYFKTNLIKNIKGIPLNRNWLLRFGFLKTKYGYELDHFETPMGRPYFTLEYSIDHKLMQIYPLDEGRMDLSHINYVHQLQNLYFAITGQELELKK